MSFNFRVVGKTVHGTPYFEVHEVYYDSSGEIIGYAENPVTIGGESIEDLHWYLDKIKVALDKPVLRFKESEK